MIFVRNHRTTPLKKEDFRVETKVNENCNNDKSLLTDIASAESLQKFTDDDKNAKYDDVLEK